MAMIVPTAVIFYPTKTALTKDLGVTVFRIQLSTCNTMKNAALFLCLPNKFSPRELACSVIALVCLLFTNLSHATDDSSAQVDRTQALRGCFGTYAAAPRGNDRRVDTARLLTELVDLRANTYNWLIHNAATDWDDLKLFLPQAREQRIQVWVTLVPPTEQPPKNKAYAEPFRLDFERWAVEIAKLSITEPNLVAWSIDDFTHNLGFYTPEKMRGLVGEARKINPRLAFVPCCYQPKILPKFISDYRDSIDGILFPYRHESARINLTDADLVTAEVQQIREMAGASLPVIVDVYATAHSTLGGTTPDYVRTVMTGARESADGVLVYCHQNPTTQAEKYRLIKELFHTWSRPQAGAAATTPQALYRERLAIFPEDR